MIHLHFKKCYEKYISSGYKKTTVRIGDKSKRFYKGREIKICIGDRYHPRTILETVITNVQIKEWENVEDDDIKRESPDCRNKEGLWCVMFHINKKLLDSSDVVTIITWK